MKWLGAGAAAGFIYWLVFIVILGNPWGPDLTPLRPEAHEDES